jgi:riboflavin kinase / FMN adenylyltransferase
VDSIISIGNFDGLHLGHRRLMKYMTKTASELGLRSVVITYDNHPSAILSDHPHQSILMSPARKKTAILDLGIDQVEMLHFDKTLAATSADSFIHSYLIPEFHLRLLVLGHDSHFGFGREANFSYLEDHARKFGFTLHYVEPEEYDGRIISSSWIRELLQQGDLELANRLLGAPYALAGTVVRGKGLGEGLGFPTANMLVDCIDQLLPSNGIYLSKVYIGDTVFFGLTNIGNGPTMKKNEPIGIETYILDFNQDIYGCNMTIELIKYLREEKLFSDKFQLISAMKEDLNMARRIITEERP